MKPASRVAFALFACFSAGIAMSWLLFVAWFHASPSFTVKALQFLAVSGLLSLVTGSAALLGVTRHVPSFGIRVGVASVAGSAAALASLMVTPLVMFKERSDLNILVITLLFFLLISLAFGLLVAMLTTRQLQALHHAAERVAAGEFGARVRVEGTDEVAMLGLAFNRMSEQLGELFEREQQLERDRRSLVASVSHDLRTPLASIRAMVEAVNDGVISDQETVHRYLSLIGTETIHLGELIEDLFELSRIESGSDELRLSMVPIQELVSETVDGLQAQAQARGVLLRAQGGDGLSPLSLDGPRMQRVLVNLIGNALRHTMSGGHVDVRILPQDGHIRLEVADSGEGIAPEDQPHVFERFYRAEKSRSRGAGGAGLGLAIARAIVEAHHGTIHVESVQGQGSRFVVTL